MLALRSKPDRLQVVSSLGSNVARHEPTSDVLAPAREIKQLERYGPEVVDICKGQGTTERWIPGASSEELPAVVPKSVDFNSKIGPLAGGRKFKNATKPYNRRTK